MDLTAGTTTPTLDPTVVDVRVPRGPSGLWGALVATLVGPTRQRELPVVDSDDLGRRRSMFDYDPSLATALDA